MPGLFHFPTDLVDKGRPYIAFSCSPSESQERITQICLPLVGSVQYSDGGQYGTIDMGNLDIATELVSAGFKQSIPQLMEEAQSKLTGEIGKVGALGAGIILAKRFGAQKTAESLEFRAQTIKNPRTNTLFQGNMLRQFQFNFKMIGRNKHEVDVIHGIQNEFRNKSYASKKNVLMLKYPDTWTIKFLDPREGKFAKELDHMPKIFTSYLTSVTTTINSTSNTFRYDMTPHEVDVSLQFQETKVLTRDEIIALENGDRTDRSLEAAEHLVNLAEEGGAKVGAKAVEMGGVGVEQFKQWQADKFEHDLQAAKDALNPSVNPSEKEGE